VRRLCISVACVLAATACKSADDKNPRRARDGGTEGVRDAAVAAPPAPPPGPMPDAEHAALTGRILVAVGREGAFRVAAVDPVTGAATTLTPAGASWFPAPGPPALAIATVDDGDVHLEQLARLGKRPKDVVLLGPRSARVRSPTSTADGTVILVEADLASYRDLYRIDPETGDETRLTADVEGNFEPSLSPDGERVAFTSSRDGNAEIYVMPSAGGAPTRLTTLDKDDWQPLWSPDGAWIAFLSDREGAPRLFLVHPDGTGVRPAHADAALGEEQTAAWSPDGTRLAYVVSRRDGAAEVWAAEVATGKPRRVSAGGGRDEAPTWSPDGAHVAYVSTRDRRIDLWVARADGTAEARVTDTPEEEWIPRWLP